MLRLINRLMKRTQITQTDRSVPESRSLRRKARRGITLIEMAIVLLVIGIIMAIVYSNLDFGIADNAKRLAVKNTAKVLQIQWERYEFSNTPLQDGETLEKLTQKSPDLMSFTPISKESILDPWKKPYFICTDSSGQRQLCSYGADGQMGGDGQNADFMLTDEATWPAWLTGKTEEK